MTEKEEIKYLEVLHNFRQTVDEIDNRMKNNNPMKISKVQRLLLEISDAYILLLEG